MSRTVNIFALIQPSRKDIYKKRIYVLNFIRILVILILRVSSLSQEGNYKSYPEIRKKVAVYFARFFTK